MSETVVQDIAPGGQARRLRRPFRTGYGPAVGQKDRLLAAAKQSLLSRGHAGSTARELAADAGVSLAAIGYHFGSKDALLDVALTEVLEDWAATVMAAVARPVDGADVVEQLTSGWRSAVDGFEAYAPLLTAFLDGVLHSRGSDAARARIAAHLAVSRGHIRTGLEALLPELGPEHADAAASFALAVVDGLFVQWLVDPDAVPDGEALVAAVRRFLAALPPRPPTEGGTRD